MIMGIGLTIIGILFLVWLIGFIVIGIAVGCFGLPEIGNWKIVGCLVVLLLLLFWPISVPIMIYTQRATGMEKG